MRLRLIRVPYDLGSRGLRMGAGPEKLAAAADRLRARGVEVTDAPVEAAPGLRDEIGSTFALHRAVAAEVGGALAEGAFPLVLSGRCSSAIGAVAAAGAGTALAWFDGHGDFNTPETTVSGFLDGMALATVLGRCWAAMAAGLGGFAPVAEERVVLVGARDLDRAEAEYLERSRVRLLRPTKARGDDLGGVLDALAGRVERIYLHVDLDVHDPAEGSANGFAAPGGLTADEVQRVVREAAARVPIAAASVTAYDPAFDTDGRMLETGLRLMELIAELAAGGASRS